MNFISHDFCPATDLSPNGFGQTGFGPDAPAFLAAGLSVWWHTFRPYHRGKQRKFNQLQLRLRQRRMRKRGR